MYDVIAPPLILLAPFIVFLQHNRYPLLTPEVLLSCAGFVVIGGGLGLASGAMGRLPRSLVIAFVVLIFVDVQFDILNWWTFLAGFAVLGIASWFLGSLAAQALSAAFAAIIVSTLLWPVSAGTPKESTHTRSADGAATVASDLPVLVHIVLDEHIGIEGVPSDLETARDVKEKLRSFYVSNGFRLFGRAYSQHRVTTSSISHMMNFLVDSYDERVLSKEMASVYQMNRNEYIDRLQEQGFKTSIDQTSYLRLCSDGQMSVENCRTEGSTDFEIFSRSPASVAQKIRAIFGVYAELSYLHTRSVQFSRELHNFAESYGISIPAITWQRLSKGALRAMEQLEELPRQISTAAPGSAFLTHVLLPHYPYVYNSDCSLRELEDWLTRTSESAPSGMVNTRETRLRRYQAYLEQVECVTVRLGAIFDAMRNAGTYRDAIIIIHGDHGSRINLVDPFVETIERVSDADFRDAFSTLFAIKAPGIESGYDRSTRSIQELFASWVAAEFHELPNRDVDEGPDWVFISDKGRTWVRHPLRGFDVDEP